MKTVTIRVPTVGAEDSASGDPHGWEAEPLVVATLGGASYRVRETLLEVARKFGEVGSREEDFKAALENALGKLTQGTAWVVKVTKGEAGEYGFSLTRSEAAQRLIKEQL